MRRPGRRPGGPDTRGEILAAAREQFASHGFDRTTIRAVGRAAGVDPALVHHYFGGKDDLFLAALEVPFDPRVAVANALDGPPRRLGERVVRTFLSIWDDPAQRSSLLAIVRSSVASESAAGLLREGVLRMVFDRLGSARPDGDPRLRGGLVASQMLGLVMARYVLGIEPVASMTGDELVAHIGPTIQRYLTT